MAQTFTVPSRSYAAGAHPFGPFAVAAGSTRVKLSLLREAWPDSVGVEIIAITWEASVDGGVTWPRTESFGAAGGELPLDKFGQPQPASFVTWPLQTPCQIRGTVVLQQPLTTTITVALS